MHTHKIKYILKVQRNLSYVTYLGSTEIQNNVYTKYRTYLPASILESISYNGV